MTDRKEWLLKKKKAISGTEISVLLGSNKYKTPLDLYKDKLSDEIKNDFILAAERGKYLEPLLDRKYLMENPGVKELLYQEGDFFILSKDYPIFGCTPDRIAVNHDGTMRLLEYKTAVGRALGNWKYGEPPENYKDQVIWNMSILKEHHPELQMDYGIIPALLDDEYREFIVDYDPHKVEYMRTVASDFWNTYVIPKIPPKAISCADWKKNNTIASDSIKEASADIILALDNISLLKEEIAPLLKEVELLKSNIKYKEEQIEYQELIIRDFIGDAKSVTIDGTEVLTCKNNKDKIEFLESDFKEENIDLYNKYIKKTPGARSLKIKYDVIKKILR